MKTTIIAIGVLLVTVLFSAFICGGYALSTYNTAKSLRVRYDAKLKGNEATFDNMWKKIKGTAEVTDAQKVALKEILVGYAEARNSGQSGGGALATWIQESVPNVDTSTFNNLQNIIAGSRDSWTFNQLELVDIAREYNQMLERQPSGIILSLLKFEKIDAKVITSTRTEETFKSGKDDETTVFRANN